MARLLTFIPIRFGDPITALDIHQSFLCTGSALGKLNMYDLDQNQINCIAEISEEPIRAVSIQENGDIYSVIGDLYILITYNATRSQDLINDVLYHDRDHSIMRCNNTAVLYANGKVCLAIVDPTYDTSQERVSVYDVLHVTNISDQQFQQYENVKFTQNSILFDFDGDRILLLEDRKRLLMYEIGNGKQVQIYTLNIRTYISLVKLGTESVYLIMGSTQLCHISLQHLGQIQLIGEHDQDIIALCFGTGQVYGSYPLAEEQALTPKRIVVTVDISGVVKIWENERLIEIISIYQLPNIQIQHEFRLFSMGYPYYCVISGKRIAISSDIGVLVLESEYLEIFNISVEQITDITEILKQQNKQHHHLQFQLLLLSIFISNMPFVQRIILIFSIDFIL